MIYSRKLLSFAIVLLPFSLLSFEDGQGDFEQSKTAHITVFIHGSVHSHLLLLSPQAVWNDSICEDSWYIKMLSKIRQNPLLWQMRPMLAMGPQEISRDVIDRFHKRSLSKQEAPLALYSVVAAYDALAQALAPHQKDHLYYAYGHLGLLSQNYRKEVGREFYFWLVQLAQHYQERYEFVEIDIVAHSHGGNIALWLGHYEDEYGRGLHIDNLVMDGTPIQVETFRFAYRPVFGRVFNRYSDGDRVQGIDRMSTQRGKSYKTFSDQRLPVSYENSNVCDVRLLVNNKNKKVGHGNMFLMDESHSATQAFRPIPFMVFTPVILAACQDITLNSFDCNIVDTPELVYVEIKDQDSILAQSIDLSDLSAQFTQLVLYNWRPDHSARQHAKPARIATITIGAIRELWNDGQIKKEEVPQLIAKL